MQIIIFDNAEQVAENAAQWVSELISKKAKPVLGLATGSTPISLYQQLVHKHKNEGLSFSNVSSFNLDEYHNINADNPQSYRSFMKVHLFDHVDIEQSNTYLPTFTSKQNPREQGLSYERKINELGGIDLQILGTKIQIVSIPTKESNSYDVELLELNKKL